MTTIPDKNVHCLALEGTFDDCQDIVKACFRSHWKSKLPLGAVNSINWARILAQIVYYFYATFQLEWESTDVDFVVPTGNFGNVLAGHYAKRMGAKIGHLVIATNVNDILARMHRTGEYALTKVQKTMSPSMDIVISSNFERLLHEMVEGGDTVARKYDDLAKNGSFSVLPPQLSIYKSEFSAYTSSEEDTAAAVRKAHTLGLLIDPHTGVGLSCALRYVEERKPKKSCGCDGHSTLRQIRGDDVSNFGKRP
eukprot:Selendium_serpulae@DN5479_c0_g1_i3.p2